jgi:hypothetical protein
MILPLAAVTALVAALVAGVLGPFAFVATTETVSLWPRFAEAGT